MINANITICSKCNLTYSKHVMFSSFWAHKEAVIKCKSYAMPTSADDDNEDTRPFLTNGLPLNHAQSAYMMVPHDSKCQLYNVH